jgi:hypothetical protein
MDYKAKLHEAITELQQATKRGEMPRELRLVRIEALTEEYFAATGEMCDSTACERMADLCLYEELTDDDRMKVRNNEYPFLSETQLARRQEGKHVRKETMSGEIPLGASDSYGVDGRNYGQPTKRERNTSENRFIDKAAKSRNKERQSVYNDFTKVQPIITSTFR